MKFDKYIANYLYLQKEVSIASIGTFRLDNQVVIPAESERFNFFPAEGVTFEWDKSVANSPDFETYLFSCIKRPATVILADFEDYLLQTKSFLGSGKPVTIQGVGTLTKVNQTAELVFALGGVSNEKIAFVSYDTENYLSVKKQPVINQKKVKIFLGSTLAIFIIAVTVWAFTTGRIKFPERKKEPIAEVKKEILPDTSIKVQPFNPAAQDTSKATAVPANDTVRYRIIFLATKYREKALKKLTEFTSADKIQYDSAVMRDTLRYRLFIYKKALPVDTTKLKVDFEKLFKHFIVVEKAD